MSVSELSPAAQNYLKIIWGAQEWSGESVAPSAIAQKAGVRLSSVSDAVRRLADQGLVSHTRYGAVTLTDQGRLLALAMVRRHRLIETFLHDVLGYGWEEVHDEADVLEHAVSDTFIDRLDAHLGHPARDPHGDPIPDRHGGIDRPHAVPLTNVDRPATVVVERIADDDPGLLQFCADAGVVVGTRLTVADGPPFSDVVTLEPEGHEPVDLGTAALAALWVAPA